ncbi:MAG: DUF5690 family protein [Verrucomicrobiota bacterium JB023]|nr:DUF5690 family protein [Verrucomicrobiota bacterium JB023]
MFRPLKLSGTPLVVFAALASFTTYFCMYAFRKPFAAGLYEGDFFFGLELKTAFVIFQIFGYTLSKYLGVKVCSEATGLRRSLLIVSFILIAEFALILFGLVPGHWKVLALFLNGLPLGMVWGLVVKYLEGRKASDFLLAFLCCSFVLASGIVKDIGRWLMSSQGVPETWMPALTGAIFLPLLLVAVYALSRIPPPTEEDIASRTQRPAMNRKERGAFFRKFLPGLVAVLLFFFLITAFRDFRDNFEVNIFADLGFGEEEEGLLSKVAIWAAFGSLAGLACINFIKDHRRAFLATCLLMVLGMVVLGGSTLLYKAEKIEPFTWMVLTAVGAYVAYVPLNAIFFERLMAATQSIGTSVFMIQLSDAIGYSGSVVLQLYKDIGQGSLSYLSFYQGFSYLMAVLGILLVLFFLIYFLGQTRSTQPSSQ